MAAGAHHDVDDGASRIPSEHPTVVVLGAGINGAAVARELVLSGASVVVIESDDIAAGTTAWSTRLIHGGLRYLEHGEVGLVRESLVERERLARAAPHLVRRRVFYVPVRGRWGGLWAAAARLLGWESMAKRLRGGRGRGAWTLGIGLTIYDLLSIGSRWPRHRIVRAGGPPMPLVDPESYPFAAIYSDGQATFPERLA
ncbi:MAG: FAD-dependent oxidoreductase, partial [Planctomycetia bacterium]